MGSLLNQIPLKKDKTPNLYSKKFVPLVEACSGLRIKGFMSACFLTDYACSLLPEVRSVRCNHVSYELTIAEPTCWHSFLTLSTYGGKDVQPPPTSLNNCVIGIKRPNSSLHFWDMEASAFCHLELSWIPMGMARQQTWMRVWRDY